MTATGFAWIDGVVTPLAEARIGVLDRGLLYGDGLFEVLRTVDGRPFLLERHLARLQRGALAIRLPPPPADRIEAAVAPVVAALGPGIEARLRIVVTRGPGGLDVGLDQLGPPTVIVIAEPLRLPPDEVYERGIRLATVARRMPPDPTIKALAYLDRVLARDDARRAGADDALVLDAAGRVAECATANVFGVQAGRILTPPVDRVLPGVTRGLVLELCDGREAELVPDACDELFVTSAVKGVVPVGALDGTPRRIGPVTREVIARYRARLLHERRRPSLL